MASESECELVTRKADEVIAVESEEDVTGCDSNVEPVITKFHKAFAWSAAKETRSKTQGYTGIVRTIVMTDKSAGCGFILQEIVSYVSGSGYDTDKRHFTEAWRVSSRGVISPQRGRDIFVVPWDAREETTGCFRVRAASWFVPREVGLTYANMGLELNVEGVDCVLHCKAKRVKQRFHSYHKFVRKAKLTWHRVPMNRASWAPIYTEQLNEWRHREYNAECKFFVIK